MLIPSGVRWKYVVLLLRWRAKPSGLICFPPSDNAPQFYNNSAIALGESIYKPFPLLDLVESDRRGRAPLPNPLNQSAVARTI